MERGVGSRDARIGTTGPQEELVFGTNEPETINNIACVRAEKKKAKVSVCTFRVSLKADHYREGRNFLSGCTGSRRCFGAILDDFKCIGSNARPIPMYVIKNEVLNCTRFVRRPLS